MIQDLSGRGPSVTRLAVSGVATVMVIALAIYLLMLRYTGQFEDTVPVTAIVTSTGDGLPARADVKFRGVLVGAVESVEIAAKGARQHVHIVLKAARAGNIPDNVTVRVIPNNIFGVTAVELVDKGPAKGRLHSGSLLSEDPGGTTELQTTLTTLRTVLDHIEPERLGRVLGTLADALSSDYRTPGSTVERLDHWITTVDGIPGIGDLLGNLGRASEALSQSAPDLVTVLSQSVTAANTITERRANLVAMLSTAGGTVDSINTLFARNPNSGKEVVSGADNFIGTLAGDPDALPVTIANLNNAVHRLGTVFHWGPSHQMSWNMHIGFTPFRQYTAQDCPHYGDLYGPRCGGPSVPAVAPPQQVPPGWRGPAAVTAVVGGTPNAAQMLLLGSALTGTTVTPDQPTTGGGH